MISAVDAEAYEHGGGEENTSVPMYKKVEEIGPHVKCALCSSSENDPLMYGDIYEMEDVISHYFCLLLSSNLVQNGEDHEGILGFFPKDIKKEVRRGSHLRCSFCRKTGATVGCSIKSCKKTFHLPCGLKNGSMHQFFDQFLSFCVKHRPNQKINKEFLKMAEDDEDAKICVICYEEVSNEVSSDTLWAPCCRKRWFHRICLQRQALAQGYYFKCPTCNDNTSFNSEMKKFGIYIPEMDAAWEREPQAFEDLLSTYKRCDAPTCQCPDGRNFVQNTGSWRLVRCNSCGSQGTHIVCGRLKIAAASSSWRCPLCIEVISRADQRQAVETAKISGSAGHHSSNFRLSSTRLTGSSNSSSLRTRPDMMAELHASKRRKSQISNLGSSSSSLAEANSSLPAESKVNLNDSGPSRWSSDEEEILIVDGSGSDSDVEVVNEVEMEASKSHLAKITVPAPNYHDKLKVLKDSLELNAVSVEIVKTEFPQMRKDSTKDYPVVTMPTSYCVPSPSKKNDSIPSSLKSRVPPSPFRQNVHSSSQGTPAHDSSVSCGTSGEPAFKIDDVRHSNELFSSSKSGESQTTAQHPAAQSLQMFPFRNQFPLISQQHIVYMPVQTEDGQTAIQPMVPWASLTMGQQQLLQLCGQPQQHTRDQSGMSPDIVTLD